jgi:hypothetical protein
MMTYSTRLKDRAVLHYQLHLQSLRKVSSVYGVAKSTLSRWLKEDIQKDIVPRQKPRMKLHDVIGKVVARTMYEQPFQTANDLIHAIRGDTGALVSRSTVYRSLRRIGLSYKCASRCRSHDAVPIGHPFLSKDSYQDDAIAVDESSFYWNDVPRRGWSKRGRRVKKARPTHRTRVTLLLAVGREGIIHYELRTKGVKGHHFADFVHNLPGGRPLIADNCSIHRCPAARAVYAEKNIELRLIPPYCPWYNPVEFCFSEIKAKYRPLRLKYPSATFTQDVLACMFSLRHYDTYFQYAKEKCDLDRLAP